MTEPKNQQTVECKTYMSQSLYIHAATTGPSQPAMVSVEGSRVSLDLSPAEALSLAQSLTWAANGGNTGRSGTPEADSEADRTG